VYLCDIDVEKNKTIVKIGELPMNAIATTRPSATTGTLTQIRIIAFLLGLAFALPAAFFPAFAKLFIALGAFTIVAACVFMEIKSEREAEISNPPVVAELPEQYRGLSSFDKIVYLEMGEKGAPGQLELPSLAQLQRESRSRKHPIMIKYPTGREVFLIDCDQFVAVLLDRMTEDANKAAEHALQMGLKRYGKVHSVSAELERFLTDKSILEVIKSDFRGNMLMVINRSGEKIVREMIKKGVQASRPKVSEKEAKNLPLSLE
jgi:hypothetical protein